MATSIPANQLTQEQKSALQAKGQYDPYAYYNPDYLATLTTTQTTPTGATQTTPTVTMPSAPSAGAGPTVYSAPTFGIPEVPEMPEIPTPTVPAAPEIPAVEVTPAPEYEISPEQKAWEEMYSGQLQQWIEAGGYGIPEETQAKMIQRTTDTLKAKEAEDIRVMRNNMERRGLTNSGLVFANEQKIRANTTIAIANSITDIQIQSALMKMASFEKALGAAGEYLGYLSEQSQLAYQPKVLTWQAQTQSDLIRYQEQINALLQEHNMQFQAAMASYDTERQRAFLQYSTQAEANLTAYNVNAQAKLMEYDAKNAAAAMAYQAQVQMQLARYAAEMEIAKMQLAQAYTMQNMQQQAYWTDWINQQSFEREKELIQMQIEANERAAQQAGKGQLWGTMLGLGLGAIF